MEAVKSQEMRRISTIQDMIRASAKQFGDNPAFLVKKEKNGKYSEITYKTLKHDVDSLGTKLLNMGLAGAKIAIVGENCYEWVVTYLAALNGVGVAVPLDKEIPAEEMHAHIKTAKCDAVFYTESYSKYFENLDIKYKINMTQTEKASSHTAGEQPIYDLLESGALLLQKGDQSFTDAEIDPHAMSVILFTSGTTEQSKGVMLSHNNLVSDIVATSQVCKVNTTDRTLSILPIHHTFESTIGILIVLYNGASVAFCEGLKYISKNLTEAKVTILLGVPLIIESVYDKLWKQIDKQGKRKKVEAAIKLSKRLSRLGIDIRRRLFKEIHDKFGGNLRIIISGAAALNPKVVRGMEDFGFRILQGYGLTECSPLVAGTPESFDTYAKSYSVGQAIPGVKIKIVDKDEDGVGEIICKGQNVMLGYFNDPKRTEQALKDGWFYTGDLGFLDEEECLYITGRKKNVIVTKNGKNIYPEEVEYYLNESRYIEESLVEGVYNIDTEEITVKAQIRPAYDIIQEEFGDDIDDEKVRSIIKKVIDEFNERMPIYKRIRGFVVRHEEFIKTTSKKIKRQANSADRKRWSDDQL